ncbi:MAG: thrombospondin type 3 repeat-containing protein [Rhodoferax sp.]|nr:thrombospondin type 3 repeat-containing protein [Rhodoferax sp.]
MKRFISTQSIAAAAVALGALVAASSVHARSDVFFSIGVQVPGFYVQPAPVYVQPRTFYAPPPNYYQRYDDGRRYGNGWRHGGPQWQRRGPYGDFDRDGIRNQYDRDLDGDGIPNRYDQRPDKANRR